MSENKIPLLLFSAGLDSTFMLLQQLGTTDVDLLYVKGRQSGDKVEIELRHREQIKEKLHKLERDHYRRTGNQDYTEYKHIRRDTTVVNELYDGNMVARTWVQPITWLTAALTIIDPQRHSKLCIGYVAGDGIISEVENIRIAWEAMQKFTKRSVVPIEFPLVRTTKDDLYYEMDSRFYSDLWTCELPIYDSMATEQACGRCRPCLTDAAARLVFEKDRRMTVDAWHAQRVRNIEQVEKAQSYKMPTEEVPPQLELVSANSQ